MYLISLFAAIISIIFMYIDNLMTDTWPESLEGTMISELRKLD